MAQSIAEIGDYYFVLPFFRSRAYRLATDPWHVAGPGGSPISAVDWAILTQHQKRHLFDTILAPVWHPKEVRKCFLGPLGCLLGTSRASLGSQKVPNSKMAPLAHPFWTHFWIILGPKRESKKEPKIDI